MSVDVLGIVETKVNKTAISSNPSGEAGKCQLNKYRDKLARNYR